MATRERIELQNDRVSSTAINDTGPSQCYHHKTGPCLASPEGYRGRGMAPLYSSLTGVAEPLNTLPVGRTVLETYLASSYPSDSYVPDGRLLCIRKRCASIRVYSTWPYFIMHLADTCMPFDTLDPTGFCGLSRFRNDIKVILIPQWLTRAPRMARIRMRTRQYRLREFSRHSWLLDSSSMTRTFRHVQQLNQASPA
ncbi:hypothetical protein EDD17DRAFT_1549323 [Pisolithus thermaeus]|nr:hypothetical protein EDD17DRAFT_1549323 [Pisolithus thermaeus]